MASVACVEVVEQVAGLGGVGAVGHHVIVDGFERQANRCDVHVHACVGDVLSVAGVSGQQVVLHCGEVVVEGVHAVAASTAPRHEQHRIGALIGDGLGDRHGGVLARLPHGFGDREGGHLRLVLQDHIVPTAPSQGRVPLVPGSVQVRPVLVQAKPPSGVGLCGAVEPVVVELVFNEVVKAVLGGVAVPVHQDGHRRWGAGGTVATTAGPVPGGPVAFAPGPVPGGPIVGVGLVGPPSRQVRFVHGIEEQRVVH